MGIAVRNLASYLSAAVVGDNTPKTITHTLGTIPQFVILTPLAAGVDCFVVSKSATTVVVQGAQGTFDVLVIK